MSDGVTWFRILPGLTRDAPPEPMKVTLRKIKMPPFLEGEIVMYVDLSSWRFSHDCETFYKYEVQDGKLVAVKEGSEE